MSSQKAFIERVRKEGFGIDANGKPTGLTPHVLSSFEGMLDLISKELYSDSLHFVFELIQNAQDNTYAEKVLPHLKFILLDHDPTNSQNSEGCLCVINNEKGFKESDIISICSATRSTKVSKKADGFIGEKGIGFKSVFKVSSFPHIFSNGFQFRLLGDDKITGLSYIIPYWVDYLPDIVKESRDKTCILLPLIKDKYSEIRTSFLKYKSEVTLFLDKIQSVEITIPADNYEVVFTTTKSGNILQQATTLNGNVLREQKFYLANKIVPVPKKLNEEKRLGVTERTITVAFPLDKYESHNVFSYLPTEMHSGLPFIINADFILAASRESIIKNSWNAWLFEEIARLVASLISSLAKSGLTNTNIYSFIPLRADAKKAGGVFLSLVDDVIEQLKTKAFVKDCSDNLRVPSEIRTVKKEFRELFCDASHSVNWVHTEPALHVNRLKQVGVKNITPNEQKLYYQQSDFIEKQDDDWFIKYILYHAQLNQSDAKEFPCIPLEGGGLACLGSQSTYKPLETGKALVPSGIFFPKVKSLRQSLFDRICSRDDSAQILAHLSLQAFSYSHYVFEQISPILEEKAVAASLQDKQKFIDVIFDWWDELEIDDYEDYGLPVLLSDERLVLSDSPQAPFVLPEKSKAEWTYLFSSEFEKSKLSILNDYYFKKLHRNIEDYYEKIGVEKFPSPISSFQRAISEIGPNYEDYDKYLNDGFFQNSARYQSTYIKTAEIKLMPTAFWRVEGLCNEEYQTLLDYFESLIVSDGRSINRNLRTVASYYYRRNKYQYFESTFNFFLKRVPWVKTNQGYRLPSQCFVDDPNLRQIFGSDFPYLSVQMPENLIKFLEVKRDAETKTIIEYLKRLNSSVSVKIKTIIAIYTALSNRKDIDASDFSDNALIYIPPNKRKEAQWCTSAQVIWDDVSKYIDDSVFDSLQSWYPEELKNFFVKKLNIKESMDASNYADLWINLQNKNQLNDREWNLYNKAFVIIASVIKKNESPEWLKQFKKQAKLYSNKDTWVSADDEPQAFFPDETKLRIAFSTKITFVKKLEDHSYEWMLPLVKFLDFECFSDVVEEELISDNVTNLEPTNKLLTDYSCKLIVRLLSNKITQGRELVERLQADSHIEALLNFREARIREIRVRLFIPHTTISHITSSHTVFLDFKQKVLFLKNDAEPDELRDDFERLFIAQVLRDYTSKLERDTLEDSISKMLGIVSKERFDKQMKRKPDWHTPRAVANHIDKIIKGRAVHELDIPVQQEVQQTDAGEALQNETDEETNQVSSRTTANDKPRSFTKNTSDISKGPIKTSQERSTSDKSRRLSLIDTSNSKTDSSNDFSKNSSSNHFTTNEESGYTRPLRLTKSRSASISNRINHARRNKLRSYVISNEKNLNSNEENNESKEQQKYRKELGNKAELCVLDDLKAKGYIAQRMPENNPGYDLVATNPNSGEYFYVEVKGDSSRWSDKGVGISKRQYDEAVVKGSSYYLAIVDNLSDTPSPPIYIKNPISYITEYRFDSGWSDLSSNLGRVSVDEAKESILVQLQSETEDAVCKKILEYCDEMSYPFPEIGAELQDDSGRVILENIEMLWEVERIAVFIDETSELRTMDTYKDWTIVIASEYSKVERVLNQKFEDV